MTAEFVGVICYVLALCAMINSAGFYALAGASSDFDRTTGNRWARNATLAAIALAAAGFAMRA